MRSPSSGVETRWWQFLCAGMAHAVLCALAFPPVSLWPVALVAPMPIVWAACRANGRAFSASFLLALGTLPFWVLTHLYLIKVTPLGFPLLCLYLSLYPALFAAIAGMLLRAAPALPGAVIVPVAWTGLELLRGELVLTGYPWYLAGQPLIDVPSLASPAALMSVYAVSLLVSALCGAAADAAGWTGRRRSRGGIAAGVVTLVWLLTSLLAAWLPHPATTTLRVAVVQTNVLQDNKLSWPARARLDDYRRSADLTRQAARLVPRTDFIVWPETMFPGDTLDPSGVAQIEATGFPPLQFETPYALPEGRSVTTLPRRFFFDALLALQREVDLPLVVGAIDNANPIVLPVADHPGYVRLAGKNEFNTAFVIDNGQVQPDRYHKMDLTPFGEVIPYLWRWPNLQKQVLDLGATGMAFNLDFGRTPSALTLVIRRADAPDLTLLAAAPICFEATKPLTCRRLAMDAPAGRAAVIINGSNDGWFSDFLGRDMHLQCARWRCVELGLPMVRAVNTGVSAAIDRDGRLLALGPAGSERPEGVDGVLLAEVPMVLSGPSTPFARAGLWPLLILLAVMACSVPLSRTLTRTSASRPAR